jgi:hypothetical protein
MSLIATREQSLSAFGFFHLTKGFIVSFIGVVTSYQLVAIQSIDDLSKPSIELPKCRL